MCPVAFDTELYVDPAVHKRTEANTPSSNAGSSTGAGLAVSEVISRIIVALDVRYPHFNLCKHTPWSKLRFAHSVLDPATYPHNLVTIYPSIETAVPTRSIDVSLSVVYPSFDLCEWLPMKQSAS